MPFERLDIQGARFHHLQVSRQSNEPRLILASESPRRRDLLSQLGVDFEVAAPSIVEDKAPRQGEAPEQFAVRLALTKAQAVATESPGAAVLGADTVVVLDSVVMGKPGSAEEAAAMLKRLRGRLHRVITAVAFSGPGSEPPVTAHSETLVRFREYSDEEIRAYVLSGDPMDKAGAYAIQSQALRPAAEVQGCLLSVIGLPACMVAGLLEGAGLAVSPVAGLSVPEPCRSRPGGCSLATLAG